MLVRPDAAEVLDKAFLAYNAGAQTFARKALPMSDFLLKCFFEGQAILLERDRAALEARRQAETKAAAVMAAADKIRPIGVVGTRQAPAGAEPGG